jgi:integrase
MSNKRTPGLIKRNGVWHIEKQIRGKRVRESCGTGDRSEAERFLARRMEELRQAEVYGVRPTRTFNQAAAKFVRENQHKRSLKDDIQRLRNLMPWIGEIALDRVNMGALRPWIEARQKQGATAGTINHGLKVVRRILNLAATEWVDEHGLSWLVTAPKIRLLPDPASGKRQPYPLNWDEQNRLFRELPKHLAEMALFAVNTGCRDSEICGLRWDMEVRVPGQFASVFIIPGDRVKNSDDRLVVLNDVARAVVDAQRGINDTHVFTYRGAPVKRMLNSAWLTARKKADLQQVRVHDLKHTFGRRLRAAGVSFEDRQDLLGHRSGRMTTHYSAAELSRLVEAANRVCERDGDLPELVVLRRGKQAA